MQHRTRGEGAAALAVLFALACADTPATGPAAAEETLSDLVSSEPARLTIENDADLLSWRVTLVGGQPLSITPISGAAPSPPGMSSQSDHDFQLMLIATVEAPVIDDVTLQATHTVVRGGTALVTYNVQGPARAGGVESYDVSQPDVVSLVSAALFTDTDVAAVALKGQDVYLATATGDEAFESPAVLENMTIQNGQFLEETWRIDIPSFAGTGVVASGNTVYVTSGTGGPDIGGLSAFGREALEPSFFYQLEDARAVDVKGDELVVMRGTPGALHVLHANSGLVEDVYESGGANIPESKSTVEIARGLIFYAAGDEGLRVVDLKTGEIVAELPVPDIEGIPPELEVTNSVSLHGNLVFLANGGAGLLVARANREVDDDDDDEDGDDDDDDDEDDDDDDDDEDGDDDDDDEDGDDDDGDDEDGDDENGDDENGDEEDDDDQDDDNEDGDDQDDDDEGDSKANQARTSKPLILEVLGVVSFPEGASVNYVGGKGDLIFVATGLGGLNIIRIVRDPETGGR